MNGPFVVEKDLKVNLREFHWAKDFSMIYIDNPVGTGFSFTDDEQGI
jgi:vitellogenic carboxypeptidase-like protein